MGFSIVLTPESAQQPSTNFPAFTRVNTTEQINVLAYDATTGESAIWRTAVPQSPGSTWTAVVSYMMASATTGNVQFDVSVESVSSGDALNLLTTTSYDTANTGSGAVPGTAGYLGQISVTLTNMDSVAAGDWITFKVARNTSVGSNATGDAYLVAVDVRNS